MVFTNLLMKSLTVVLPYETSLYGEVTLKKTISLLKTFNINHLIISKDIIKEGHSIIFNYKNIWDAYNYSISRVNTEYITFLMPGDFINKDSYNIDSTADIIQLQHSRTNGIRTWEKNNNKVKLYNLYESIPDNLGLLCDKIYRTSILRDNKIKFTRNIQYAPQIFCYCALAKSKTFQVVPNKILHTVSKKVFSILEQQQFAKGFLNKLNVIETNNETLLDRLNIVKDNLQDIIFYKGIDFVFPYVTMNDPIWQEQYKKYKGLSDNEWASGIERYRDNDLLKYTLRGIAKHMPWINKLHIIVASESQIPKWINRNEVDFILHSEYIPKNILPTFNSSTIETFLPLLPRVSNTFIYSNDDLLCLRNLSPQYFFDKGKPRYSINIRGYNAAFPGDMLRRQAYNLILKSHSNNRVVVTQHGPTVFKKSWIRECYDTYKDILDKSCSRFREDQNYNQYLYTFYQMMEKTIDNTPQNIKSFCLSPKNYDIIYATDFSKFDFICLNDSNDTKDAQWDKIRKKLDLLLPEKCKYEL